MGTAEHLEGSHKSAEGSVETGTGGRGRSPVVGGVGGGGNVGETVVKCTQTSVRETRRGRNTLALAVTTTAPGTSALRPGKRLAGAASSPVSEECRSGTRVVRSINKFNPGVECQVCSRSSVTAQQAPGYECSENYRATSQYFVFIPIKIYIQ